MGKWGDQFRDRFDTDLHQAEVNAERAVQRQRAIDQNQGKLWVNLRLTAYQAVEDINESDGNDILSLDPPEQAGGSEFSIIYDRNGEKRDVRATFDRTAHTVTINGRNGMQQVYRISANDKNELEFVLNVSYKVDTIVQQMLDSLL